MGTTTTTFALNKPTVGGDDNAWGTDWNTNADKLDDLLDGTTGITPNLLTGWEVGGVVVTATAAELNILDGVTASAAELNILDGVTASTAELNILDGVTASAAELNILDGATLTVTELNYVDGVTSAIQAQLDAKYDSGDLASQAEAEAGTDNTKVMTPLRVAQASRPVLGTAVASTSGKSIDFTGIPAWARRVTVMLNGVSTNGTSPIVLRLGTSGGIEATGYAAGAFYSPSLNNFRNSSTDIPLSVVSNTAAAAIFDGAVSVMNQTGNTWIASGGIHESVSSSIGVSVAGRKALSAALDRVRITTVGGTDTFDAGTINIAWE